LTHCPRYLLRDRDAIFGDHSENKCEDLGMESCLRVLTLAESHVER